MDEIPLSPAVAASRLNRALGLDADHYARYRGRWWDRNHDLHGIGHHAPFLKSDLLPRFQVVEDLLGCFIHSPQTNFPRYLGMNTI